MDFKNKVIVITGASSGIGKETARRLVEMGCDVVIGARDANKNRKTVEELNDMKNG